MLDNLDALEVVEGVIERRGFVIVVDPSIDDEVIYFELPNQHGGICSAKVDYLNDIGLLQISAQLLCENIQPILIDQIPSLINGLQHLLPGSVFLFTCGDGEEEDQIELVLSHLVIPDQSLELQAERMIEYLHQILRWTIPLIYTFVAQRIRVRVTTDGRLTKVEGTVSVSESLEMIRVGYYGRA